MRKRASVAAFTPCRDLEKARLDRWSSPALVGAWMLVALTPACQAPAEETTIESPVAADVVSVRALSVAGGYRFEVGIRSPDLGCQQYADWWEVVSLEGELVYRRVLAHSHVAEQPFARRGVPVAVAADTVVWVRAHLHPTGYGGMAFKGSVEGGFRAEALPASFAVELAERGPRPPQCAN